MRWRVAVLACAAAGAILPASPVLVERAYSNGLYAAVQPWITRGSNAVPFSLLDLLVAVTVCAWVALLVHDFRRRSLAAAAGAAALRTVVWAAGFYIAFLAVWGLNYRRVALADKLQFEAERISQDAARDLALAAADQVNALYAAAHAAPPVAPRAVDPALARAFAQAQRDLGAVRLAVPGRPKHTVLDVYFKRAGVDGMTDPFFLETLVTGELLPIERPFVVAHEWSHLAGIGDEGEANFVGWLTCLRGTDVHRYSGWLFLFSELSQSIRHEDRATVGARLTPGARADLRAIALRIQRHLSPRISAAGWRVYDRYLKANRVEHGTASYAEVVRLALGVRFAPGWVPRQRTVR